MNVCCIVSIFSNNETIPKMFSRFLVKKPLFLHICESLKLSNFINNIYLITDDTQIEHFAELNDLNCICEENIPFKQQINDLRYVNNCKIMIESRYKKKYDYIVFVQPNYPLIKANTIDNSIKVLDASNLDIAITVKFSEISDKKQWKKDQDGNGIKINDIKNLDDLDINPKFEEVNAIKIFKTKIFEENHFTHISRALLIELSFPENLAIKNHIDWWIAEKYLKRKRILIRTDGYNEIGLGHIYRQLILAHNLIDHKILFVSKKEFKLGLSLIKEHNYELETFSSDEEFCSIVDKFQPNIIINDILDTNEDYMKNLKSKEIFLINFEDLGEGTKHADLVINALYQKKNLLKNHYWGKDYYILREDFVLLGKKVINKEVKNILVTFGGTDPNDYTEKVLDVLNEINLEGIKVVVILGLGYKHTMKLKKKIDNFHFDLILKQHVNHISKYMFEADIALTAAGRTVYELASIGIPTIVLTENERALLHTFANLQNGIINVGLGVNILPEDVKQVIKNLINDFELRKKNNQLMLKNNLRSGLDNVMSLIFSQYEKWNEGK